MEVIEITKVALYAPYAYSPEWSLSIAEVTDSHGNTYITHYNIQAFAGYIGRTVAVRVKDVDGIKRISLV